MTSCSEDGSKRKSSRINKNSSYTITKRSDGRYEIKKSGKIKYMDNNMVASYDSYNNHTKLPLHSSYRSTNLSSSIYDMISSKNYAGKYKVGNPYKIAGRTYYPMENPPADYKEIGISSWYGPNFHGKNTANGDIFNMHELTVAHRVLPMPSIVNVTNLENGRSIVVMINDRGPFKKDRVIDLSKETARRLGVLEKGTAVVEIRYLKNETDDMLKRYNLLKHKYK